MRFMMLVRADPNTEAGMLPTREMIETMGRYNEELVKAGVLLAADGLHASSRGARVAFGGGRVTVTDGPFAEAKELIAGYWMLQVSSREEAVEWACRVPLEDGVVELRQVLEIGDFPEDAVSPEALAREQELSERVRQQQADR
ncbi:YciI family protein [Kitasatospora nipponensis]|uniref:YciI family protein n=1 Tax=Kitasatospora nipponensis TaxID=258049 RepID=A0ABP4HKM1_9ACTN